MPKCPEWEAYFLDAREAATSCCGMAKAPFCGSIVVPCCTGKANEQHCFLDKSGTRYNTVCKGIYVGVSRRLAVPPEQDAQIVTGETNWQSKGIYIYIHIATIGSKRACKTILRSYLESAKTSEANPRTSFCLAKALGI